ncbi:unnamed protein product [Symbiodinium natans]|uniref:Methyltransferase domain-containing protein n=1 Tax=Symbiodinium natans TaxID=878477 RepID=A0A812PBJ0_9DINO|nr:unnamed protein product [Symbiodinium natans]
MSPRSRRRTFLLLLLLPFRQACGGDETDSDIIFLPTSQRLRPGARPNVASYCWLRQDLDFFYKFSYRQCCCADWSQAFRCWSVDPTVAPQKTLYHTCCVYSYGPGSACAPPSSGKRLRLQLPGLPLLSAWLTPSTYVYEPYFGALLTQGHLLEPLLGSLGPVLRAVDIGAGKGMDSLVLSKMGHLVVAMEQDPQELQLMDANKVLNNASFEVVGSDFWDVDASAGALLAASGGEPFDLIVANFLTYLPLEVFAKLLELVERIGARDFVWPLPCGKEEWDTDDEQRANREQALRRFELVDVVTFGNVGSSDLWNLVVTQSSRD